MPYLTVTQAKAHLLDLIRKSDETMQSFIITKGGKPKAVLMSVEEYEGWLETIEIMSNRRLMKDIREAKRELKKGKYYTFEEVFKRPQKPRRRG